MPVTSEIYVGLHFGSGQAASTLSGLDVVRAQDAIPDATRGRIQVYLPTTTLPRLGLAHVTMHATCLTSKNGRREQWPNLPSILIICAAQQPQLFLKPRLAIRVSQPDCARRADDAPVSHLLLKDSLLQAAGQCQKSVASSISVPVVECENSSVSVLVAQTVDTNVMKSASCPRKRSGSSFNCPNHESALISSSGSGHWLRLRMGMYGQRLRPLKTSTLVAQSLDCNHPDESLKNGGNARHKYIACTLCLERFLSVDNPVLCQGPSDASSSVQSPPLQQCPEVSLATQTRRSRAQFQNRRIGLVFEQVASAHSRGFFSLLTHALVEQEDREPNSNFSLVGIHADSQTDAELGRGQHSVSRGPHELVHWPNTPTTPEKLARNSDLLARWKRDATQSGSLGKAEANG